MKVNRWSQVKKVGKSLGTHGISGGLKMLIEDKYQVDISQLEVIFFNMNGSLVPLIPIEYREGRPYIVFFRGKENIDLIEAYAQKDIYLSVDAIAADEEQKHPLEKCKVRDRNYGYLGVIHVIEQTEFQRIAVIQNNKGNPMRLPFPEEWIITSEADEVLIELPEGMIDLYDITKDES